MTMLDQAEEIEIVSIAPDGGNRVEGAELAEHLSRHCPNLKLTDLPLAHGDAGWTLAITSTSSGRISWSWALTVIRLQFIVGGVTSLMLTRRRSPCFILSRTSRDQVSGISAGSLPAFAHRG